MRRRPAALAVAALTLAACGSAPNDREQGAAAAMNERELIVLAAPRSGDAYYASVRGDIFDFHVAYARAIADRDDVIVLTDKASHDAYAAATQTHRTTKAAKRAKSFTTKRRDYISLIIANFKYGISLKYEQILFTRSIHFSISNFIMSKFSPIAIVNWTWGRNKNFGI